MNKSILRLQVNKPPKTCIFCGSQDRVTHDHVPPKNIFPPPRPSNLITVPSCKTCNSSDSKDEEYFRLKICMSENVGTNTDASKNRETIFRSMTRPDAKGLKRAFIKDIETVQLKTPSGIYLPEQRWAFHVDLERIFRVVKKSVKGLYYHETGYRFNDQAYGIDVHSDETLIENPAEMLEELKTTILLPLSLQPPKIIGNGVFSYRHYITIEDPYVSVWALAFYDQVPFLAITGPLASKTTS